MGQLRSFSRMGGTTPYIPFAFPVSVDNFDGYAAGAGWLQLFDSALGAAKAVTAVAITDGGTAYVVGDRLVVAGGTGTAATFRVTQVSSTGVVQGIVIESEGNYTVDPATTNSATGGAGSTVSLTITLTQRVPFKSINIAAAGPIGSFLSSLGPVTLTKGLTFALSSTETTYTALTTAYDLWGEVDQYELPVPNDNVITLATVDLSSGTHIQSPWTHLEGIKRLTRITFTQPAGTTKRWLMVMAAFTANSAMVPLLAIPMFDTSGDGSAIQKRSGAFDFGKEGLAIYGNTTRSSAGGGIAKTDCNGCALYCTTTADPMGTTVSNLAIDTVATILTTSFKPL